MNTLRKMMLIGLLAFCSFTASAGAASPAAALPAMSALAVQATGRFSVSLFTHLAKALTSSRTSLTTRAPSSTVIDGNHMIVEAKRLSPGSAPFSALSGPRKKQQQL